MSATLRGGTSLESNAMDTVSALDATFQQLQATYHGTRHALVKLQLHEDATTDVAVIANMERAQEYTQRRIGQLESSLHFRAETREALHKKRATLTSALHANEEHIKQLTKLRDAMDRECRALEEDVGMLQLQLEQQSRHITTLKASCGSLRRRMDGLHREKRDIVASIRARAQATGTAISVEPAFRYELGNEDADVDDADATPVTHRHDDATQ